MANPDGPKVVDYSGHAPVITRPSARLPQSNFNSSMFTTLPRNAPGRSSKGKSEDANGAFAAIHLLHNPHDLAERLLRELTKTSERFEVRLLMMSLTSRLIGAHRLYLPAFYPYAMRYLQPHQREVTQVLAACVQAAHELVPPESVATLLQHLVRHFVSDKSRPEVITVGLNTVVRPSHAHRTCADAAPTRRPTVAAACGGGGAAVAAPPRLSHTTTPVSRRAHRLEC